MNTAAARRQLAKGLEVWSGDRPSFGDAMVVGTAENLPAGCDLLVGATRCTQVKVPFVATVNLRDATPIFSDPGGAAKLATALNENGAVIGPMTADGIPTITFESIETKLAIMVSISEFVYEIESGTQFSSDINS